ncbi:MAG: GNAT family N-acetyltransferase [Aliishimia sp.]
MTTYTIPEFSTDRLLLRAPKLADLPRVTEFFASERSHIVGGPLNAREASRAMMQIYGMWALRGHSFWYIADKATDIFLGWTGIINGPAWDEPELGWTVVEEAEGKSIAFEAATAARAYAATQLGYDGVISYIAPQNSRSATLAKRLGASFEREGELLGHDVHVYRHPKVGAAA